MCLRDFFLSLAFFLILAFDGSGQNVSTASLQQAISYRTAFYNFYFTNPDSAVYYAQKMAAEPSYKSYLREMIHKDFYGMFHETIKEKIGEGAPKNKTRQWGKEYQKFFTKTLNFNASGFIMPKVMSNIMKS